MDGGKELRAAVEAQHGELITSMQLRLAPGKVSTTDVVLAEGRSVLLIFGLTTWNAKLSS